MNVPIPQLLAREIERMRVAGVPVGEDDLRGLYISDNEADRLLGEVAEQPPPGVAERLEHLAAACRLDEVEAGVIALCLAAETRPAVERLIAYVQDDVSRRRPRVELALRLLAPDPMAALTVFDAASPLRRHRLITISDEPGQTWTPLTSRLVALDSRVLGFLLGGDAIDEVIEPVARGIEVDLARSAPPEAAALASLPATSLHPPVAVLWGGDPGRIREGANALAVGAGLTGLIELDTAAAKDHVVGLWEHLARADREAGLRRAALLVIRTDVLEPQERDRLERTIRDGVAPLTVVATETEPRFAAPLVRVADLDFETRLACWRQELAAAGVAPIPDAELEALTGKFRLPRDNITAAVGLARGIALTRDPDNPVIGRDDLYAAARTQSAVILSSLARKVNPHYRWDDIILEPDPLTQLREFCAMIEHRHLVYDTWGFDRKLAMGKGVIALFAGQSGTGKTMAADVIAGQLGLDLYKIDLSGVVSKYIGETEKNIGAIFKDAEQSNAILFFDEADALFGKRSEVKDAHDRYANIETAYLLQRMEEYSGAVVLSTNLKMNLDEAFLRRMHFVIDFPMPEEEYRLRIWRSTIPPELPVDTDVDLEFLARQFKISGGNIRNIVLAAAFFAADEGVPMNMGHLIRGTRREFQKLGRLVTSTEFGDYYHLVH